MNAKKQRRKINTKKQKRYTKVHFQLHGGNWNDIDTAAKYLSVALLKNQFKTCIDVKKFISIQTNGKKDIHEEAGHGDFQYLNFIGLLLGICIILWIRFFICKKKVQRRFRGRRF